MTKHADFRDKILAEYSPEELEEFNQLSRTVELGEQLRAARLAAKMTQEELARAAGLNQSEISATERSGER